MARLDRVLKNLCLFKTRSQATLACKEGRVLVDGTPARPSQLVRPRQTIVIRDRLGLVETEVILVQVPDKQVSKKEAGSFAEVSVRRKESMP